MLPQDTDPEQLYRELRRLARARLRDGGRNTLLDTQALVHEAWLRMERSAPPLEDKPRWLAYASRAMRSVIVDMARQRLAERHGGGVQHVTWTEAVGGHAEQSDAEVLALHQALDQLEALDPRLARVVEMRYFAGLDDEQVAQALEVSSRTVRRDWEKARRLLAHALRS